MNINNSLYSQSGWVQQPSGVTVKLNKVFFANSRIGWIVGDSGVILKTSNAGNNWVLQNSNTDHTLRSVYFLNESTGYVIGGNYTPLTFSFLKILKTTNGGATWFYVFDSASKEYSISDVWFTNSNTGYVSGFGGNESKSVGVILETTNGGSNWVNSVTESSLSSIRFANQTTGYLTGNYYSDVWGDSIFILKTDDTGLNWHKVYSGTNGRFNSSFFLDNNTGWTAGFIYGVNDLILRTTNGGANWQHLSPSSLTYINSIFFASYDTGWYCSSGIYKTINSGLNWVNQLPSNGNDYYTSIFFNDNNLGFIVGNNGKIFKTISGGILLTVSNEESTPDKFYMAQNYPNPFNPKTIINYQLPKTNNVYLKVYNVLGKEVATLVNDKQNAGSYYVEFDAGNLSSGIYFYKLETSDYTETKRMILLK